MHLLPWPTVGDSHCNPAKWPGGVNSRRNHRHDHRGVRFQRAVLCPHGCNSYGDCGGPIGSRACRLRRRRDDRHCFCQPRPQHHSLRRAWSDHHHRCARRLCHSAHLPWLSNAPTWSCHQFLRRAAIHASRSCSGGFSRWNPGRGPQYCLLCTSFTLPTISPSFILYTPVAFTPTSITSHPTSLCCPWSADQPPTSTPIS